MIDDIRATKTIRQRLIRQREVLLALEPSRSRRQRLANVDAALSWLEAGVYGRCSVCGETLDAELLASDPATMTCKRCRRLAENHRPAPEKRCGRSIRPGELGLVSLEDDDERRQVQFEAASRLAAWMQA